MDWTDELPEDCPPADASEPGGLFYRLVVTDPPTAEDFMSQADLAPSRDWGPPAKDCAARGLSLQGSDEDVAILRNRIPSLRTKYTAQGNLDRALGLLKHTPSRHYKAHHTWWVPRDYAVEELFHVPESPT